MATSSFPSLHHLTSASASSTGAENNNNSINDVFSTIPTSTFAIRSAYTTALSRFVTGFADLGRHRSGIGQSMFEVARSISLPPHFVELRHEVAHEEMPGLARLVRSAREAVDWLWGVYWGRLVVDDDEDYENYGNDGGANVGGGGDNANKKGQVRDVVGLGLSVEEVRAKSKIALKEFRSQRVAALKAGKGKKGNKAQAKATSEQCESYCHGADSREKWEEVVGVLIDEGLVVPSLKQRGPLLDSAMQGAYMLWDELLLQLAQCSSDFIEIFLERATAHNSAFTSADDTVDGSDPAKWAMYRWIMHMLRSDKWEEARAGIAADWDSAALRECSLYPDNQWSQKLAEEILQDASENVRRVFGKSSDASLLQEEDEDEDVEEVSVIGEEGAEVPMDDVASSDGGWRMGTGEWKALPIGMVRT